MEYENFTLDHLGASYYAENYRRNQPDVQDIISITGNGGEITIEYTYLDPRRKRVSSSLNVFSDSYHLLTPELTEILQTHGHEKPGAMKDRLLELGIKDTTKTTP